MLGVKSFNETHRKSAGPVTTLTIFLIALLSLIFGVVNVICSVIDGFFACKRKGIGVLLAIILLVGTTVAGAYISGLSGTEEKEQLTEVLVQAEEDRKTVAPEKEVEMTKEEPMEEEVAVPEEEPAPEEVSIFEEEVAPEETEEMEDISDFDLISVQDQYPETVGWIYFEDGHISYPIMQSSDNEKYKTCGYTGEEAWTGAIFLDCRSSSDFSDSNSIIYGHNMKDGTMFGTLRDYREDPGYYNDHQYFQVITRERTYRYRIFAYMDVPDTYVLYDYVGDASLEFVKDAEPVRIKSYMDSEIPVNETKKVVTLSTCTDKDQLRFVVLGVMTDEGDQ